MIPVTVIGVVGDPRIIHLPDVPRAGDFVSVPGYVEGTVESVHWFHDPVAAGALTQVELVLVGA
jgi:hypothetical protein